MEILIEETYDECNWNYFIISNSCNLFNINSCNNNTNNDFWINFSTDNEISSITGNIYILEEI